MCIASYGWLPPLRGENQGKTEATPIHPITLQLFPFPKGKSWVLKQILPRCFHTAGGWPFSALTLPWSGSAEARPSHTENLDHSRSPLCSSQSFTSRWSLVRILPSPWSPESWSMPRLWYKCDICIRKWVPRDSWLFLTLRSNPSSPEC